MEKKLAIIGGGAAGLCAAKHMLSSTQGFKLKPVIFEQRSTVGGTWVYEDVVESANENVFSSIYKSLRTNLPKEIMNLGDFLYPDHLPSFLHHTDVRTYLDRYTLHYALDQVIRHNTRVLCVRPYGNGGGSSDKPVGWRVAYQDLKTQKTNVEEFDGVVVCNGHYSKPSHPSIPGLQNFRNKYMHSHYYRSSEYLTGKTALVLGAGPSAIDISMELCKSFRDVYISHRSKRRFQTILPDNLTELQNIRAVDKDGGVLFEDGSKRHVDWFISCTGYEFQFDFLNYNEIGLRVEHEKKVMKDLYKHMFLINQPSLCFIGIPWTVAPFPFINQQCVYAARVYSGSKQLPPNEVMLRHTKIEFEAKLARGDSARYFHKMGMEQFDYLSDIGCLAGARIVPSYVKKLYAFVMEERRKNVLNYRELNFKVMSDDEFVLMKE